MDLKFYSKTNTARLSLKKFLVCLFFAAIYSGSINAQGTALAFDGSNDTVSIPTHPSLNLSSSITIEAWVNYSKIFGGVQNVLSKSSSATNNSYIFPRTRDAWKSLEFLLKLNANDTFTVLKVNYSGTSSNTLRNTWHHLAASYDGTYMRVYIDGVLAGSLLAPGNITVNNNNLILGGHGGFEDEFFGGKVDDIRIWNRPLSGCEITANKSCHLTGNETGLAAYYKLNGALLQTTVIDETSNHNNGVMHNFLLSGLLSNWAVGTVTGNCSVFTPVNATAGSLQANVAVGSTIQLTASGGGTYAWTGPNGFTSNLQNPVIPGATILASGNYTVVVTNNGCSASASTLVTVAPLAKALNFDGVDGNVKIPNSASFNTTAALTIETWVYPTSNSPLVQNVLSKSRPSQNNGYIFPRTDDGWQTFSFWLTVNGQWKILSAVFPGRNQWTHVAATYDGFAMKIYMNGALAGTLSAPGSITQNTNDITLGRQDGFQEFYTGSVDEMRVWSRALTECEIVNNKNCQLNGDNNGLAALNGLSAYYRFNQGLVNANNAALTSLADSSGHNNHGTLLNFELTGLSSNWAVGSAINNVTCAPYLAVQPAATSNGPIVEVGSAIELHATEGTAWAWTGPGGFTSNLQHPTRSNSTISMSGVYTVTITGNGCTSVVSTQLQVAYKAGSLHFDGVNDQIMVPGSTSLNMQKAITLEAWIKPTNNTKLVQDVMSKSTNLVNTGYIFPRTDNAWSSYIFYLHINGVWEKVTAPYAAINEWHHVAATYDGYYMRIYLDGGLSATKLIPNGGDITINANDLIIGQQTGFSEHFEGNVEEVRIWDRALSQCEIINNMECQVGQMQSNGLAAYYRFNQGFIDADNRQITTLTDMSGHANTGTLQNFALQGLTSNWSEAKVSGSCSTYAAPPVAATANGSIFSIGSTIKLLASGGSTYTWEGPNNFSSTSAIATVNNVQLNATGVYTVTAPFIRCEIKASTRLVVSQLQPIVANGNTTFCPSGSVGLSIAGTGIGYQWFLNDVAINGATTNNYVATLAGNYYVSVTTANEVLISEPVTVSIEDNVAPEPSVEDLPVINVYTDVVITGVPTALDNCANQVPGTTTSELVYSIPGTYTITWVYDDGNGNTSTQNQTVIVVKAPDVLPPVITVPANITKNNDAGVCGAVVTFAATATDESAFTITYSQDPGTVFPVGTTIVTITATDDSENTATATFTVTVIDAELPVLTVPANIAAITATGINVGNAIATDNCGTPVIAHGNIPVTFALGTTSITWTATDAAGNSVSGTQTVTVTDVAAPVLYGVPANTSVTCGALPAVPIVTATDDFDTNLAVNMTTTTIGNIVTRTWTVTDASNNTATASQVITLIPDTEAPVLTVPANIAAITATGINVGNAIATDNCGTPVISHSNIPVVFALGTTSITWTATDAAGNTTSGTQTITITDETAPVLFGVPANTSVTCGILPAVPVVTATDDFDTNLTVTMTTTTIGNIVTRTWTVTDASNNTATASQVITLIPDTEAPVLTVPANINATSGVGITIIPATATDNCSTPVISHSNIPVTFALGTTSITWTATDAVGNTTSGVQTVTITDATAPVLFGVPANTSVTCGILPAVPVVTATDDFDVNLTVTMTTTTIGNIVTRTWTVTDSGNNTASASQVITLIPDTQGPIMTAPANIEATSGVGINIGTATAIDNCSTAEITHSAVPAVFGLGVTYITWTATDAIGNFTTGIQTVTVTDVAAPVLSGVPANTSVTCGALPAVPVVTATDNFDVNLTVTMTTTTIGNIVTRTWTVTDASNNTASASQVITLIPDTEAPVLTVPANINATSGVGITIIPATATDNCGTPVISHSSIPVVFALGTTSITWTATDAAGNSVSGTQTVTVTDVAAPVLYGVPANTSVTCGVLPAVPAVYATDNFDVNLTVSMTTTTNGNTVTRTWTVTDASNNTTSASQVITLIPDTEAPVLTVPANINATSGVGITIIPATATDNCSTPVISHSNIPVIFALGTTSITWTATDAVGNTTSGVQTVTITDVTAPVLFGVPANTSVTCGALPAVPVVTATDNFDVNLTVSMSTTTYGNIVTRTWTVTDASNNTASASQVITLIPDTQGPVMTAPANIIATSGVGINIGTATAIDNCSTAEITHSAVPAVFGLGVTYITWTATDAVGNYTTGIQTVTIRDTEAPVLYGVPANTTANCGILPAVPVVTATDNFDTNLTVNMTTTTNGNIVTRTWTVIDASGNTASASQTITLVYITLGPIGGTTTVTTGSATQLSNSTAGGVWSSSNTGVATISASGLVTGVSAGNTTISYLVTISAGCSKAVTATVTVTPNCVVPVVSAANVVASTLASSTACTSPVSYVVNVTATPAATVTYTLSGATTGSGNGTGSGVVFNTGVTTVVVTAVNTCGTSSASFTVTLRDGTAPVPNVQTLPTITGQCSATLVSTSSSNNNNNNNNCNYSDDDYRYRGIISLILYYLNGYSNWGNDHQHDNNCGGNNNSGNTQTANAPKATDNCKGTITGTTTDPLTYTAQGTYTINWKFDDGNGNVTIQQQTVIVKDDVKPVIDCPGNITVSCGSSTTPSGCNSTATATDNCGSVNMTYTDAINSNGNVITRTWKATDGAGNVSTCTQTITIVDNTKPNISDVADVSVGCSSSTAPSATGTATATDNCSAVTVNYTDATSGNVITRTWRATDASGNYNTSTQKITVVADNTKPTISDVADVTVGCSSSTAPSATGTPTASDNCSAVTLTFTDATSGNLITRTWKATDASGNYNTSTQKITKGASFSASVSSVPTSSTYTGGISTNLYIGYGAQSTKLQICDLPSSGAPYTYAWSGSATNRLNTTSSSAPTFTPATYGTYTFIVTVTNKYGCTSTANITICVTDIRVPGTNGSKVYVCHKTSSRWNTSYQTLQVSVNAVSAHLNHGGCGNDDDDDRLGSCDQTPCNYASVNTATTSTTQQTVTAEGGSVAAVNSTNNTKAAASTTEEELKVTVMPNPSTTYFTLKFESKYETPVDLRVMDASGRVVDAKSKLGANSTIQVGHNYTSGTYYAEISQNGKRKVIQLIKLRG